MIDRYQVYALYKVIKKMWNAKRFETNTFVRIPRIRAQAIEVMVI